MDFPKMRSPKRAELIRIGSEKVAALVVVARKDAK